MADITKLIVKVPGAIFNRSQRKFAEKEHMKIMDEILPVIQGYLTSDMDSESFEIYRISFEKKANRLNNSLNYFRINDDYFITHLSVKDDQQVLVNDNITMSEKKLGYMAIGFIVLIATLFIISYIWDV